MQRHQDFSVKLPVFEWRIFPSGFEERRVNSPHRTWIDYYEISPAAGEQTASRLRAVVESEEIRGVGAHVERKEL